MIQFTAKAEKMIMKSQFVCQAIPLALCFMLENKITRHYCLGPSHKFMTHALTALVGLNHLYDFLGASEKTDILVKQPVEDTHGYKVQMFTNISFLVVFACCLGTTIYQKVVLGKTWDNVSVRCGFFLAKATMLTIPGHGSLLYFCMLLQWYNIALIINHRRDSIPGKSFPVQCFLAFFTMWQYFLRGNHRDRIDTVPYGEACRSGVGCSEELRWTLIFFRSLGPFIVGMQLLPLIVKARVMHVHAHIKNFDTPAPPQPVTQAPKKTTKKKKGGKVE